MAIHVQEVARVAVKDHAVAIVMIVVKVHVRDLAETRVMVIVPMYVEVINLLILNVDGKFIKTRFLQEISRKSFANFGWSSSIKRKHPFCVCRNGLREFMCRELFWRLLWWM